MSCKHEDTECAEVGNEVVCDIEIVKMKTEDSEHDKSKRDHKLSYACLKIKESEDKKSIFIFDRSSCKTNPGSEDSKQLNADDHKKHHATEGKYNLEIHTKVIYDSDIVKLETDGPEDFKIDIEEHKIRRRCLEIVKIEDMESMSTNGNSSKVNRGSEDSNNSKKEIINPKDVKIEIEPYTQNKTTDRQDATNISNGKEIIKYVGGAEEQNIDPAAITMNSQQCELKVKDRHYLKKHFRLKHDDSAEWYRCKHCEYETKSKSNLKRHFKLKHDDCAERYRCEHCGYEMKGKHYLKVHCKLKHDDSAEWYKCQHCEFKTKNKSTLNKHFKVKHDDNAEWYKCKHCEFETKRKGVLKHHFKLKHDDSAEWYKCKHCEYKTKDKSLLKRHFKLKHDVTTEYYKCEHCGFETKDKSILKRHFKVKHDDCAEWYKCKHCQYETKDKCFLKRHFKLKHDDNAEWYKCQHCEFKTKRKDLFNRHFKKKHNCSPE